MVMMLAMMLWLIPAVNNNSNWKGSRHNLALPSTNNDISAQNSYSGMVP